MHSVAVLQGACAPHIFLAPTPSLQLQIIKKNVEIRPNMMISAQKWQKKKKKKVLYTFVYFFPH